MNLDRLKVFLVNLNPYVCYSHPMCTEKFSVAFWASHPELGLRDSLGSDDFDTLEEAEAAFAAGSPDTRISHIQLDGPGVYKVRDNPAYDPKQRPVFISEERVVALERDAAQAGDVEMICNASAVRRWLRGDGLQKADLLRVASVLESGALAEP